MQTQGNHGSYGEIKPDLLTRLRKIEGQLRGIQKMVEQDTYCVDILHQLSAVISAAEKVSLKVLDSHVRHCVADAVDPTLREEKLEELTKVLEKFLQIGSSSVSR
jgi:DNA-binding FrmR family transcriptional regulator